jgi:hypothetical protein
LQASTEQQLADAFQVNSENVLLGIKVRLKLLQNLAQVLPVSMQMYLFTPQLYTTAIDYSEPSVKLLINKC